MHARRSLHMHARRSLHMHARRSFHMQQSTTHMHFVVECFVVLDPPRQTPALTERKEWQGTGRHPGLPRNFRSRTCWPVLEQANKEGFGSFLEGQDPLSLSTCMPNSVAVLSSGNTGGERQYANSVAVLTW